MYLLVFFFTVYWSVSILCYLIFSSILMCDGIKQFKFFFLNNIFTLEYLSYYYYVCVSDMVDAVAILKKKGKKEKRRIKVCDVAYLSSCNLFCWLYTPRSSLDTYVYLNYFALLPMNKIKLYSINANHVIIYLNNLFNPSRKDMTDWLYCACVHRACLWMFLI